MDKSIVHYLNFEILHNAQSKQFRASHDDININITFGFKFP